MGMDLVQVAVVVVKSLVAGLSRGPFLPESPLPDQGGLVAGRLQHLRDCNILVLQLILLVAADTRIALVQPCHQGAARGRTDGAASIMIGKPHSLRGHPVQLRGLDLRLAIASQVAIPKVVRKDVNDVRLCGGTVTRNRQDQGS